MLTSIEQWGDAPMWTVDKIANATKDWFRYLGDDDKADASAAEGIHLSGLHSRHRPAVPSWPPVCDR